MERHATTVLGVRIGNRVVMGSDGQVTMGDIALKHRTCKVRKLYGDSVLVGFSGATADALALLESGGIDVDPLRAGRVRIEDAVDLLDPSRRGVLASVVAMR